MVMSFLKTTDAIYSKCVRYILVFLITSIPLICGIDVIFRYIIKEPVHGSDEILILMQIWLYFIGFASAARERSHITARVVESAIKTNEGIARLRMGVTLIGVGISCYLLYLGYDYFSYALMVKKTTSILNYPMIWYEAAPFICFIPLIIYTLVECIFYAKRMRKSDVNFKEQNEEIDDILQDIEQNEQGERI